MWYHEIGKDATLFLSAGDADMRTNKISHAFIGRGYKSGTHQSV
jgi:hypothetical protein